VAILLMVIDCYSINDYWWLLIGIVLMAIGAYYWWILVVIN